MRNFILGLALILAGCFLEEPDIPQSADCTADGWQIDLTTGDIITDDGTGAAIECTFK